MERCGASPGAASPHLLHVVNLFVAANLVALAGWTTKVVTTFD